MFVTHRAKPGRRDEVLATWAQYLRPLIDANPDHLAYTYCFDDRDADVVRVFQLYRSAAAADAFLQLPGYAEYAEHVREHVAEPPELRTAIPQWTKGHA